jgi:hypothetical protein
VELPCDQARRAQDADPIVAPMMTARSNPTPRMRRSRPAARFPVVVISAKVTETIRGVMNYQRPGSTGVKIPA